MRVGGLGEARARCGEDSLRSKTGCSQVASHETDLSVMMARGTCMAMAVNAQSRNMHSGTEMSSS